MQACNPKPWKAEAWETTPSSRPAWATLWIQHQPGLCIKPLVKKQQTKNQNHHSEMWPLAPGCSGIASGLPGTFLKSFPSFFYLFIQFPVWRIKLQDFTLRHWATPQSCWERNQRKSVLESKFIDFLTTSCSVPFWPQVKSSVRVRSAAHIWRSHPRQPSTQARYPWTVRVWMSLRPFTPAPPSALK